MIIDTLENLEKYAAVNVLFPQVVTFLREHNPESLAPGKYILREGELFVNVTDTNPKTPEEARLESHNNMIDIQIPLDDETYGYTPRTALPEETYDAGKDITFYPGAAQSYVNLKKGMFAIFFPQDLHAPCIAGKPIRKLIFKVKA
jgi:YhcH/YjgK/YiaL family protein